MCRSMREKRNKRKHNRVSSGQIIHSANSSVARSKTNWTSNNRLCSEQVSMNSFLPANYLNHFNDYVLAVHYIDRFRIRIGAYLCIDCIVFMIRWCWFLFCITSKSTISGLSWFSTFDSVSALFSSDSRWSFIAAFVPEMKAHSLHKLPMWCHTCSQFPFGAEKK